MNSGKILTGVGRSDQLQALAVLVFLVTTFYQGLRFDTDLSGYDAAPDHHQPNGPALLPVALTFDRLAIPETWRFPANAANRQSTGLPVVHDQPSGPKFSPGAEISDG